MIEAAGGLQSPQKIMRASNKQLEEVGSRKSQQEENNTTVSAPGNLSAGYISEEEFPHLCLALGYARHDQLRSEAQKLNHLAWIYGAMDFQQKGFISLDEFQCLELDYYDRVTPIGKQSLGVQDVPGSGEKNRNIVNNKLLY